MSDNFKAEHFTQITAGTEVFADIKSEQVIRISGYVEGDVESTLRIIIENTGVTDGVLRAPFIEISGKVEGEIRAKNNLLVHSSAIINGQIFTKQFTLKEGASVNGDINSGSDVDVNQQKKRNNTAPSTNKKPAEKHYEVKEKEKPTGRDLEWEKEKQKEVPKNGNKKEEKITAEPKGNVRYTPPPAPHFVSTVLIGIPASDVEKEITEKIQKASGHFMEALGFKLEIFDEPVFDSFYQHLTYVRKGKRADEKVDDLYEQGKSAIEDAFIKKTDSSKDENLVKAAKALIEAVNKVDEIAITLGRIAIVQIMEDNIQSIAAEIISPELNKQLKDNPRLVIKPHEIYAQIAS